jgi:hypothetical protein
MNLLTRKFPTILGLLLLVALIAIAIYYFQGKTTKVSQDIVPTNVRITNISDNKFSVSWTTKVPAIGSIEYGQVGEKLTNIALDERDTTTKASYLTHHVTVLKLQPSTEYAFRILSGEKSTRFDNNGSPYTTATGPVIGETPVSQNLYGSVQLLSKIPADGSIVYLTLPGGATASTLIRQTGNYAFTLSTIRTADNRSYVKYDPSATIASITVELGDQHSLSSVSLANSAPVPTITLGQNVDYLNVDQAASIAEIQTGEAATIFNVEPLSSQSEINVVSTTTVTILNPKTNGEVLTTLRPEFRGTGPAGTTLSIAISGQKAISDNVTIATDSTWSFAPVIDLKAGKQKIAVSYVGTDGVTTRLEREFTINTSGAALDPAFVSSPSASIKATASTKPATGSATPRAGMPDTSEGTPVSGVIENTLLTLGLGIVIMVVGAALLLL